MDHPSGFSVPVMFDSLKSLYTLYSQTTHKQDFMTLSQKNM